TFLKLTPGPSYLLRRLSSNKPKALMLKGGVPTDMVLGHFQDRIPNNILREVIMKYGRNKVSLE
ncbi:MAG: hypothetical protein WCL60_12555, partial [Methylococcales bacterium]